MNPSSAEAAALNKTRDTLRGGREINVQIKPKALDDAIAAEGTGGFLIEKLFVRKVPFLKMDTELLPAWGNNLKELLVYSGKDEAYLDTLSEESQIEVLKVGRELNFFILKECLALQAQMMEAHGQGTAVKEVMEQALQKLLEQQKKT